MATGRRRSADGLKARHPTKLIYVSDAVPGWRRRRRGRAFEYLDRRGSTIRSRPQLRRIRSLAIPPAWTDVWISPDPNAHLQATGRDARGRKQYRYHPEWRRLRDQHNFDRMLEFASALPRLRRRIERDLKRPGLGREKVLAAVVRLLEATRIRVGNEEYARSNRSFGLTTLRDRHVVADGTGIKFVFPAKSGRRLAVRLYDRRLTRVVMRCEELPGQRLFQYLDESGEPQPVHSSDVNDYIREAAGGEFTAKDFRTWSGTVAAAKFLLDAGVPTDLPDARHIAISAIDSVAELLFNTRAVCRKSYVHPALTEAYLDGSWRAVASVGEGKRVGAEQLVVRLLSRSRGRKPVLAVARH